MSIRLLLPTLTLFAIGCQTVPYQGKARNVTLKPRKEGVISIPPKYRDEDRNRAKTLMAENCSPRIPEILEEGEVAVGTEVNSSESERKRKSSTRSIGSLFGAALSINKPGGTDTSSSSRTTQIKEWHINYACKKGKRRARKL